MASGVGGGPDIGLLAQAGLFADLAPSVWERLASEWEPVHVLGGQEVIREGASDEAVYLVVSGRLQVSASGPDGPVLLREIGRGEVVGEMALIDRTPRAASVHAMRDSELLRLDADRFHAVIDEHPSLLLAVSRALVRRLRATSRGEGARSTVRTLVVVPAGPSAPAARFARLLAERLDRPAPPVVDEGLVVDRFGADAVGNPESSGGDLHAWLQALEVEHRYVVHVAADADGAWAHRCLRQADRVLLVADADAGPSSSLPARSAVASLVGGRVPVHLVLVHPASRDHPRGTARWLQGEPAYARHHHVRDGSGRDHGRVGRLVTGRGVGLTLGGGGPRGFAHVGAFRAFEEVGLPIDAVGGTSIGSIMGGFLALGWDQDTIESRVREGFIEHGPVIDRTLPVVSLASARRLESLLRDDRFFGDLDLEDLWLPHFAVSTNLTRAEVVVDDRGPAWQAIRASISLPGVLPAVCRGTDLLVDGGIMNNLPIDVMAARLGGGVHVAIDLEPPVDLEVTHPFPSAVSGWSVLAQRLNPLRPTPRIPGPLAVLLRSRAVGSTWGLRERLEAFPVDLYLTPPVGGYDLLDFTIAPELVQRGYEYTLEQLQQLDGRLLETIRSRRRPTDVAPQPRAPTGGQAAVEAVP